MVSLLEMEPGRKSLLVYKKKDNQKYYNLVLCHNNMWVIHLNYKNWGAFSFTVKSK
jgi:hypothetical protein